MKGRFNNHKKIGIITLFIILLLNTSVFASIGIEDEVSAYLLGDYETGEILEEYNIDKPIEVASITKLMSYLIIMDELKSGSISMEDAIYIDKDTTKIKGSSLYLEEGEVFSLEELLNALMVVSANDATCALSKHIGGTEEVFVRRMNEKAEEIGLKNTIFLNSTGLPENGEQNIMTSEDIFNMARHIIKEYPEVVEMSTIPYIEVANRDYKIQNTNPLLGEIEGIDGLKTGYTDKAGYCLVSTLGVQGSDIDLEDFRIISIVMGTESIEKRKQLGKEVTEYGLYNYSKSKLLNEEVEVDTLYLPKSIDKEVEVYPIENLSIMKKHGDSIDVELVFNEEIELPLKKLDKVGKIKIYRNEELIDEVDAVVHKDIEKEGIIRWITRSLSEFLKSISKKISG